MTQFSPSEVKTAIAPITVKPAGIACEAELYLGPNETTKVASSGRVPFVSTGGVQNVSLPITMPAVGTYHGYIDVFAAGSRFLAYILTEDVIIQPPVEGIDFDLAKPSVTPATITPGTAITITCPVTSKCSKEQTTTAKVIIYEGSILPGHGTKLAEYTSPAFTISPNQTYNVIVHHTAVAGTIDRRDIEVEIYIAGKLVKQSEWDDVYYVERMPGVTIEFNGLSVLDIEGIPFTSVGTETLLTWDAFAQYFKTAWADPGYISNALGLVKCLQAKTAGWDMTINQALVNKLAIAIIQCGIEHPEYLTAFARSIPAPENLWNPPLPIGGPYYIGQIIQDPSGWAYYIVTAVLENGVYATRYWKVPWWYRWNAVIAMQHCISYLQPYSSGPIAILANPIEVSMIRGISMTVIGKAAGLNLNIYGLGYTYMTENYLWLYPQFTAPMPPPVYRGGGEIQAAVDPTTKQVTFLPSVLTANGVFTRGSYYRGIYDGLIAISAYQSNLGREYMAEVAQFKVKNLLRVTGEGII